MHNTERYYRNMTNDTLKKYHIDYSTYEEHFKYILRIDIEDDLRFMKMEIRKRKLRKLNLRSRFESIFVEIDKMKAPEDLQELLIACKTDEDAEKVLGFIKRCHEVDQDWEEDWRETEK